MIGRLDPHRQRRGVDLPGRPGALVGPGVGEVDVGQVEVSIADRGERRIKGDGHVRCSAAHLGKRIGRVDDAIQLERDRPQLVTIGAGGKRCRLGRARPPRGFELRHRHRRIVRQGHCGLEHRGRGRQVDARRKCAGHHGRGSRTAGLEGLGQGVLQVRKGEVRLGRALEDVLIRVPRDLGVRRPRSQHHRHKYQREQGGDRAARAYHQRMDPERLRGLPKAELHQHLDGSLRPATAVELAEAVGMTVTLDEARARMVGPERCRNQAELLGFFDLPIAVLQTSAALERAAAELVEDLAADTIRYAEIRWAPRLHLDRGLSVEDVISAVVAGVARTTSALGERAPLIMLIVTAMRSHPPAANAELARTAGAFGGEVVGFDLAGPEAEWPAPPHAVAFVAARESGLRLTAHAGEVPDAEHVREVLAFGVERIAHGVSAIEDPDLVAQLRKLGVTLDLCPTSNVQAGVVADLSDHPLAALHRAGVSVTISTDDLTVTGTTLSDEMARIAEAQGLSAAELQAIALTAFERSFAASELVAPRLAEARAAWRTWSASLIA